MSWAMTGLFTAHLLAFGRLWVRRGGLRYARLTALFALLVAHYGMKAAAVDMPLGPVALTGVLRSAALLLAAWSLVDFLWRRLARRATPSNGASP